MYFCLEYRIVPYNFSSKAKSLKYLKADNLILIHSTNITVLKITSCFTSLALLKSLQDATLPLTTGHLHMCFCIECSLLMPTTLSC